jgi:uncharacterized membrane protein
MHTIEKSIEVKVPVSTAYNQWTQFEEFPHFMSGVKTVKQVDDTHLLWTVDIAGREEKWNAEITEQHTDQRIAWHSTSGAENAGVVTFHYIDPNTTRIMLQLSYDPQGFIENAGSALGLVNRYVDAALKKFKEFIEARQVETGAWRGNVENESIQ